MKYLNAIGDGFMSGLKFVLDYMSALLIGNLVLMVGTAVLAFVVFAVFGPIDLPAPTGERNIPWNILMHFGIVPMLFAKAGRRLTDMI